MLFHSSPELAETVTADSTLNARQQYDTAHVLRDSAFKCTLYRTFVQASPWCKRSLFTYADWVACMDLKMPF